MSHSWRSTSFCAKANILRIWGIDITIYGEKKNKTVNVSLEDKTQMTSNFLSKLVERKLLLQKEKVLYFIYFFMAAQMWHSFSLMSTIQSRFLHTRNAINFDHVFVACIIKWSTNTTNTILPIYRGPARNGNQPTSLTIPAWRCIINAVGGQPSPLISD